MITVGQRYRRGLSFIEVVISIAILATAIAALVGNVFTLNLSHRSNQEVATVNQVVGALAERIQGVNWDKVGANEAPWTWSRLAPTVASAPSTPWKANPADPDTFDAPLDITPGDAADANPAWVIQPMTETADDDEHNLLSDEIALLQERSGLDDLRIWVEWYPKEALLGISSQSEWNRKVNDTNPLMVQSSSFDPARQDDTLIVRIVARWTSISGGERHYEISFARRR